MRITPLFLAVWILPAFSEAAPIAHDSFESYTVGASLNGANGGTGFTGAWSSNAAVRVVSASLSYQAGIVSVNGGNQAIQVNGALGNPSPLDNVFSRAFTGLSGDVYFSMLFRPVVNGGANQDDFFQFMLNDDTDAENSGAIGMRNSTGTGGNDGYFARIRNSSADFNAEATPNVLSVEGRTDFLVGRFSTNGGGTFQRFDLWVNPNSNLMTAPDATLIANSGTSLIDFITLRVAFLDSGDQYQIDAITIGTQFSDVVNVVPEPASLAVWSLLALGVGGFGLRHRNEKFFRC